MDCAFGKIALDDCGKLTDICATMTGIEQLLTVAHAYADAEAVNLSTVSSRALNDGKKLDLLEDGRVGITVDRLEGTMQWFSDNWPDCPWPVDIPRPQVTVNASQS
jgi:hypothetical protein